MSHGRIPGPEPLLTPSEVAALFRVNPKTVTRWARTGQLTSIRTLGGHRRYREAEIRALLAGNPAPPAADDSTRCPRCTYKLGSSSHFAQCGGTP